MKTHTYDTIRVLLVSTVRICHELDHDIEEDSPPTKKMHANAWELSQSAELIRQLILRGP